MPAPNFGELCEESGRCAEGLFCLNDPLYVSEVNGEVLPYCSKECDEGCPRGYRCTELEPSGNACQKIPTAGERGIGDECWQNPEEPFAEPSCGEDLRCSGSRRDPNTQELIEPGICTMSCTLENCCPEGWGCAAITPFLALCVESVEDDEGFECSGDKPSLESLTSNREGNDESGPEIVMGSNSNGGCSVGVNDHSCNFLLIFCLSLGLMITSRLRLKD